MWEEDKEGGEGRGRQGEGVCSKERRKRKKKRKTGKGREGRRGCEIQPRRSLAIATPAMEVRKTGENERPGLGGPVSQFDVNWKEKRKGRSRKV